MKADELNDFYRIPADNRDLNYQKYTNLGNLEDSTNKDYNSHNTIRKNINEIKTLLLDLEIVKKSMERND